MEINVKNLCVMVTAGGSGIGRNIATAFSEGGAAVHVCDIDANALKVLRETHPAIGTFVADVGSESDIDAWFDAAQTQLGGLDVMVNNAGISGPTGPIETLSVADWDLTMKVNLGSQFLTSRRAVPLLREAGGGSIVNISSTAGLWGYPLRAPYTCSKWAIIGLTKTLAMELGADKIRVNAICPGSISGERIDRVISAEAASRNLPIETVKEKYTKAVSLNTFIDAEEIANQVLFLCSELGRNISGQALSIDGHTETMRY